jgi:uncharacterized protein
VNRLAIRWTCSLLLLVGLSSFAAGTGIPPPPTQFVTDSANFISPSTRLTLEQRLESYERQTGHQLLVWIGRTTGDTPLEDWANEAFKSWRIGRRGIDDGLAVFVLADDRKIRIEVGYGLEGVVPDAKASRIIGDVMLPRIRSGDRDGAIAAGVDALISAIGGADQRAPVAPDYRQRPAQKQASPLEIAFCALVAIALLAFLITHPALALFMFSTMFSGRGGGYGGGGYGGGGGGGFSGGGGSSGGGGASGSW